MVTDDDPRGSPPTGTPRRRRARRHPRRARRRRRLAGAAARSASSTTPTTRASRRLQEAVAAAYLHENDLNPFAFPSLLRMEREVVAMAADLFHGDPGAGQAHQRRHREHLPGRAGGPRPRPHGAGHRRAQIVTAGDGPPGVRQGVPLPRRRPRCGCRSAPTAGPTSPPPPRRSTTAPALVVGSAPCYPYGVIDPIPELAGAGGRSGASSATSTPASAAGCCRSWSGSASRCRRGTSGSTGVTSLSADIHKYGWCVQGRVAAAPPRRRTCCRHQYFLFDDWPGGLYGSATTAGTRPAAPIAAAWADDHAPRRRRLPAPGRRGAGRRPAASRTGVEAIDGLRVTGDPVPGGLGVRRPTRAARHRRRWPT